MSSVVGMCFAGIILTLGATMVVYPAISQLVGLAVAQSSTTWNNVKDAAIGDGISNGVLATGIYGLNGSTFDRIRGDATNGLDVDVTRMSGIITPADTYANPTTANQVWSLGGVFNGTTWDRVRATTMTSASSTGIQAVGAHMTDAVTNWPLLGDWVSGLIVTDASNAVSNPTTNTSTVVKAGAGKVRSVNVNVIGTTSTVRLFNDATSPCDTNFVMQLSTAVLATTQINHSFTVGICALTAGAAAADISVLYR